MSKKLTIYKVQELSNVSYKSVYVAKIPLLKNLLMNAVYLMLLTGNQKTNVHSTNEFNLIFAA